MSVADLTEKNASAQGLQGVCKRRRRRSAQAWAKIVRESERFGTEVTASRHGVSRQQIYGWRARLKAGRSDRGQDTGTPAFTELRVVESAPFLAEPAMLQAAEGSDAPGPACIELAFGTLRLSFPRDMAMEQLAELLLRLETRA